MLPVLFDSKIVTVESQLKNSSLYSPDLAPIPKENRTWGLWDMAAIWVGMAVCIPTYLLASYMIKSGLTWVEALVIIALGNLIITIPMVLNGHAGVKYGIPFPVIGRASFGTRGIHIAAVVRGIVACGWFGIQTWIGGLAFYEIWHAIQGTDPSVQLDLGKFVGFFLFWLVNVYFIWKGTESIKWLEKFAAPILIAIGVGLIIWGAQSTGGFMKVLDKSQQLAMPAAQISDVSEGQLSVNLYPAKDRNDVVKAGEFRLFVNGDPITDPNEWTSIDAYGQSVTLTRQQLGQDIPTLVSDAGALTIQYRSTGGLQSQNVPISAKTPGGSFLDKLWSYLLWLTAMVGFWATMAISIADITRYTATQRNQVLGQFIGLPGTMALFSFVGIFVTCAAVINFSDVLISEDAPWDPVTLLGKFDSPSVVITAQIFMIIATLSTNIAANVIAPANAFSNILPSKISFRSGGMITAIIGIVICPWWLLDEISSLLLFVSGFLGPVLAIIICDYFVIRKKSMEISQLFEENGIYAYGGSGYNRSAMIALFAGVLTALIGLWVPSLSFLYTLSWFSGFIVAFLVYYILMKSK